MARYIDADKFMERLKASPAFPNMGMDGYFLLDVVEELLKKFPTADFVPKSEVAREFIEIINDRIDNIRARIPYGGRAQGKTLAVEKMLLLESLKVEIAKKYTEGAK